MAKRCHFFLFFTKYVDADIYYCSFFFNFFLCKRIKRSRVPSSVCALFCLISICYSIDLSLSVSAFLWCFSYFFSPWCFSWFMARWSCGRWQESTKVCGKKLYFFFYFLRNTHNNKKTKGKKNLCCSFTFLLQSVQSNKNFCLFLFFFSILAHCIPSLSLSLSYETSAAKNLCIFVRFRASWSLRPNAQVPFCFIF